MGLSDVFLLMQLGDEVEDELLEGEDDSWAPLTDSDAENEEEEQFFSTEELELVSDLSRV